MPVETLRLAISITGSTQAGMPQPVITVMGSTQAGMPRLVVIESATFFVKRRAAGLISGLRPVSTIASHRKNHDQENHGASNPRDWSRFFMRLANPCGKTREKKSLEIVLHAVQRDDNIRVLVVRNANTRK